MFGERILGFDFVTEQLAQQHPQPAKSTDTDFAPRAAQLRQLNPLCQLPTQGQHLRQQLIPSRID